MSAVHDVLRYLLKRVPHSTQEQHDEIAALIDHDEHGASPATEDEAPATAEGASEQEGVA